MKIHIIKKGETLYALSKKYGVSLDQLIALNPQLADPNQVQVGMKIRVPSTPVSTGGYEIVHKHVVKEGDTLWKLAKAWGLPLQALIAANPQLTNPNVLLIGQVVNIPKLNVNESGGPSTSAGWGANAANTGVVPLSKAELTKPISPQPPVQPPIQPPVQPPIQPETKLQPQAKQPAPLPSQPQAQAKPPIQSQSQPKPKPQLQPQFKPQAEQLIAPAPLPNPPSVKPATGNVSPVKPTLKGEAPNFAPLPASYENFSANLPNVEPYANSFVPNYVGQSQSNVQWQSQDVGGTQSTSPPNVYPNVPQYEGFCSTDISPYSNFCNPYPVHPFGGHCNPCAYPSYGTASIPFMPYQTYTDGANPIWGSENVVYSENANYGPASVSPGANANYGPTAVSPDVNANYGPASVSPGANANYSPTSASPVPNANYGPTSVPQEVNANYGPSFVWSTPNQSISPSGVGEMWDKNVNEQAVNAEAYGFLQANYSNMPYAAQEYGAYGASPYGDYSVFCHQCGSPYRMNHPAPDSSWLSQWGDVSSGAGNEFELEQKSDGGQADPSDSVSASKGKKKTKEQRKNVSARNYKEYDSYTQASARQKGKSMPWING
ncbi:LysM peptidoglycan-binding domain-containing protein [Paenibacillus agilis]|uniref:LysM peptidoglycan-binding domain-containing protein n=1 Tax=Paenibacillus agilis TaxID=3020863 RepID=A0A559IHW8_9BACL|nr:LysM domain-containing protein [Paenibacillus agilis]TVX87272.1 LysM peptidoglycan-binding domain-containing protein [Paenibacillus agilis]